MRQIDSKYKTTGEIFKYDGTPIPEDEPLILFRGRDRLVPQMLDYYNELRIKAGTSQKNMPLLQKQIEVIKRWQAENPDRTRIPE
jgi:hypothetical protein